MTSWGPSPPTPVGFRAWGCSSSLPVVSSGLGLASFSCLLLFPPLSLFSSSSLPSLLLFLFLFLVANVNEWNGEREGWCVCVLGGGRGWGWCWCGWVRLTCGPSVGVDSTTNCMLQMSRDLMDIPPLLADTPSGRVRVCVTRQHMHGTRVAVY